MWDKKWPLPQSGMWPYKLRTRHCKTQLSSASIFPWYGADSISVKTPVYFLSSGPDTVACSKCIWVKGKADKLGGVRSKYWAIPLQLSVQTARAGRLKSSWPQHDVCLSESVGGPHIVDYIDERDSQVIYILVRLGRSEYKTNISER